MARSALREKIREQLLGLEIRQKMREAARRQGSQLRQIHIARRSGLLDNLDRALDWLSAAGINWSDESYYSVTLVYASGVTLAYDPSGVLSYASSPRLTDEGLPEQIPMFEVDSVAIS